MQEEDAQSNRDINFQIVKGERERRGQNAPDCLSVCGCLFEWVCDMFASSSLCHVYRHPCSLSEQRPSCVPLVRLNCTAFYIITISTLSVLHTHGALHAVQCVADSKDLSSQTRLDHRVVMPAILIHCACPTQDHSVFTLGLWSSLLLQSALGGCCKQLVVRIYNTVVLWVVWEINEHHFVQSLF